MPGPKILVVMRHAKSSWKTNEPDPKRPLSARGIRDAVVAGQTLSTFGIDVVLCSSAARAVQTWQCAQMGGAHCDDVRTLDSLYGASTRTVLDELRNVPANATTVLMIGHEPTVSELVTALSVRSKITAEVEEKFPTSGIAVLTDDQAWSELDVGLAHLVGFKVPRG